jgi:spore coat protein A, manganese oxidase
MDFTRRQFLKGAAATGAFVSIGGLSTFLSPRRAYPFSQSPGLTKFAIGLPGLGSGQANEIGQYIPVLTPKTLIINGVVSDYYEITADQYTEKMHPDFGNDATTLWGYADSTTKDFKYLGGVIVAQRNRPVRIRFTNNLPLPHILPVDTSSFFADAIMNPNKACIHLHGGYIPWISDGGPYAWIAPKSTGQFGPDWPLSYVPDMPKPGLGQLTYFYPNDQSARFVWYHDHAHDVTRLNAYAGIASAYLITDEYEQSLIVNGVLPNVGPPYQLGVPLIIQDKGFFSGQDQTTDPTWKNLPVPQAKGSLWYPHQYEGPTAQNLPTMLYTSTDPNSPGVDSCPFPPVETGSCGTGRWDHIDATTNPVALTIPLPDPSIVPEAFFDTMLVNGAPYPYLPVAPRRYRFRLLNGSQARFLNLQLYVQDTSADGITLVPLASGELDPNGNPILAPSNAPGPAFIQIGTEGGFLPNPVVFNTGGTDNFNSNRVMGWDLNAFLPGGVAPNPTFGNATRFNLLLAPAERADILIDFSTFHGKNLILYGDAPAPFPGGDIRNDYYPGVPNLSGIGGAPTPTPGKSPDTRIIMQFQVASTGFVSELDFAGTIAALQNSATGLPYVFQQSQPAPLDPTGKFVRQLTLNEGFDNWGRLIQRLGTTVRQPDNNQGLAEYGIPLEGFPTEITSAGKTEVWEIFNLTGDVHPIHFHLVNVQILDRQTFNWGDIANGIQPDFTPLGRIGTPRPPDPNEMGWKETVRMNPGEVIRVIQKFDLPQVPFSMTNNLSDRTGILGSEYVWHCHILEHEEHDMMRPLIVQGHYPLAVVPEAIVTHDCKDVFHIVNGVPPYTVTTDDFRLIPFPPRVNASGGTFTIFPLGGALFRKDHVVTLKIRDKEGKIVTAKVTIDKRPYQH